MMAAAKTRPFRVGADAMCTGGVCSRVTRGMRDWALSMPPVPRPGPGRAFRWSLTATW